MVETLYDKIITQDYPPLPNQIPFIPFVGISPRRYSEFFEHREERKLDNGKILKWIPTDAFPRPITKLNIKVISGIMAQTCSDFNLDLLESNSHS
jgi:hypothetical protein